MHKSEIRENIDKKGYCIIKQSSYDYFKEVCSYLGKKINQTQVTIKHHNLKGPLVTSSKPLSLHTDCQKARYIAWFCHCHDPKGGFSILSDSKKFIDELTSTEIEELKNIMLFEHDIFNRGEKKYCPLLYKNDDNSLGIYYSFWLADKEIQKNNNTFKKFTHLANDNKIKFHLKTNDILIINNHRVMHGRTEIYNFKRSLERIWIS